MSFVSSSYSVCVLEIFVSFFFSSPVPVLDIHILYVDSAEEVNAWMAKEIDPAAS